MVVVKSCSVNDLIGEPNFSALLHEYADELALDGLPHPKANIEMYQQLEVLGKIYSIAAYLDNLLIGFVNVVWSENPHYGICIASTESYFVSKNYRKTGAGNILKREAELCAHKLMSPALFISAKTGSSLALALDASKDYAETNRTFYKRLGGVSLLPDRIPSMNEIAIDNVRQLESYTLKAPQTEIPTSHVFHAGVYARTIKIPAGVVLTGALIKVATVLIMQGDCIVYIGDESVERHGYHVFAASKNRKQAFVAQSDTYLTMIFATDVKTMEKAEEEFTDDFSVLSSRRSDAVNHVVVTGE